MVTAFKKIDGVKEVDVDCGTGMAVIKFDPQKTNVEALLKDGLKDTKFTATRVEEKEKEKKG